MSKLLDNKFIALLKLVRIENLIMTGITMYFIRYFILKKVLAEYQVELGLTNTLFFLLVLSVILIAAAGYIINDYFDVKTDLINHPDTVVVDRVIKRRWAIILHITFTFAGIMLGILCALKTGYLRLAIFHIVAGVLLWFYSTHFKKQLIVGNVVVSLLTAAVVFIPFVYEMGLMQRLDPQFTIENKQIILSSFKVVCIYAIFAFITSMAREIIKDMEDFEGDKQTGGHTMPIYWGMQTSKLAAFFLIVITLLLLMFVVYNTFKAYRTVLSIDIIYIVIALIIPLFTLLWLIIKASTPNSFKNASLFLKFIMLMGLGFSLIFYYT